MLRSNRGFSIVEVNVSIAILAIAVLAMSSIFVYYTKLSSKIMNTQEVQSRVDSILARFKSQNSCNSLIKSAFGQLPYRVYSTMFTLPSININGDNMDLNFRSATFKDLPAGKLYEIAINLDGTPLAGQQVTRAEVVVSYGLVNSERVRKRSSLIFLELDGGGNIAGCLDSVSYAELEWENEGCRRLQGRMLVGPKGRQCDLSYSPIVAQTACDGMNSIKRGTRCDKL